MQALESAYRLAEASTEQRAQLAKWLDDPAEAYAWGGPWFRYPFDEQSFIEDCRWRELPNRALLDESGNMVGFGQYYQREGRCHLGHLIIAPEQRGQRLGAELVRQLAVEGCAVLVVDDCSLFVLQDNMPARSLYARLGFRAAKYPKPLEGLERCDYMIAPARSFRAQPSITTL